MNITTAVRDTKGNRVEHEERLSSEGHMQRKSLCSRIKCQIAFIKGVYHPTDLIKEDL